MDDHIKLLSILGTINNEGRQKLNSSEKLMKNSNNVDQLQNSVNHEAMVPFFQPNGQRSDETHLEPSQPYRNLQSEKDYQTYFQYAQLNPKCLPQIHKNDQPYSALSPVLNS